MIDVRQADEGSFLVARSPLTGLSCAEIIGRSVPSSRLVAFDTASRDSLRSIEAVLADGARVLIGPSSLVADDLLALMTSSDLRQSAFPCLPSRLDVAIGSLWSHVAAGSIGTPQVITIRPPLPLERVMQPGTAGNVERYGAFELCRRLIGAPTALLSHQADRRDADADLEATEILVRGDRGALATIASGGALEEGAGADVRAVEVLGESGSACVDVLSSGQLTQLTVRRGDGEVLEHSVFTPAQLVDRSIGNLIHDVRHWVERAGHWTDPWPDAARTHEMAGFAVEARAGWVDVPLVVI